MIVTINKCRSKKWFTPLGAIIGLSQGTPWRHYSIQWDNGAIRMVSDAKRKGIRAIPKYKWDKEYEVIEEIKIELPISVEEFDTWIQSKVGTKYAFWQLIGIAMITCGWVTNNPFGKDRKYLVCHEYVLVMIARFLKIEIGDSDNYDFKLADKVIDSVRTN